MLKEILGGCSYTRAYIIKKELEKRFPVVIDISDNEDKTAPPCIIRCKEKVEGVIGPEFFGAMYDSLQTRASYIRSVEQLSVPLVDEDPQQIPDEPQIPESASIPPLVHSSLMTTLWSRVKSFVEPEIKPLRHIGQGTV